MVSKKTTNTLNIKISWEKIHLNNSWNSIIQDYNKTDIDEKNDSYKEEQIESNNWYIDKNIEKTSNYKLQNINKSKDYEILLLVIVLITTTLIIYKIYNSNYKK